MNVLDDKKNGIIWFNAKRCIDGEYLALDKVLCNEVVREMNTWMSPNIERFITDENLGSYLVEDSLGNGYEDLFFGLVDGKFATSMVLAGHHGLPVRSLIDHMFAVEKLDASDVESKKVLHWADTRKLIDRSKADISSTYLNFLVVNPDMQGRGIGTNTLKSLDDNREFFVGYDETNSIYATINQNNIASRKVFERNGYRSVLRPNQDEARQYMFDNYYKVM